jgi:hypothetical protein
VDGESVSEVVCRESKEFLVGSLGGPRGASSWLDAFCGP